MSTTLGEAQGRYCAVEAYRLRDCFCFVAYASDRLQLLDVFTDDGSHATQPTRPAFSLLFAYYPRNGRLLLRCRQRAAARVLELFQRFGESVLSVQLDERALEPTFSLNVLKRKFDPPLDGDDLESVRVKALSLAYPERDGRRRVLLDTLAGDGRFAILDLLAEHGGRDRTLDQLDVRYAELEAYLRIDGGLKRYLICLWPDRCSLDQTPLGERLRACLRQWGIAYAA